MKFNKSFFTRAAALALALIMTFSFAGCSEEDQELVNAVVDIADAVLSESESEGGSESSDAQQSEETEEPSDKHTEEIPQEEEPEAQEPQQEEPQEQLPLIDEDGIYTSMEDVADYLIAYGRLPSNFITKKEARKLGWEGGGLDRYAKDKCIGGDTFGNREGLLPDGHKYIECDIDTLNQDSRGPKRIVFSEDLSLIYYTDDHYESFTLIYGEE